MSGAGGKGDKRRPGKGYADGFDRVFGKKPVPLTPEERLKKQYDEIIKDFDKKHKL